MMVVLVTLTNNNQCSLPYKFHLMQYLKKIKYSGRLLEKAVQKM